MAITGLIEREVDLDLGGVQMTPMNQLFATSDERAHTIRVTVKASGKAVGLTGAGVIGYFMRADGDTVVITGSVSGNVVTLVLPESCYVAPGHFSLIIKVTQGGDRKAVFWGDGFVTRSNTDVIVDPGDVIPSLEELLARIAEMEAATKAASTATSAANTATQQANAARDAANAAAGNANTATQQANAARDAANTAAGKADTAAQQANAARDAANKAAKSANDAADRVDASIAGAQKATQEANAARDAANTAAGNANTATQQANAARDAANEAAKSANDAAEIAGKWEDVEVAVEMRDAGFSPICTVTDRETGGKLMEFELPRGLTGLTPNITVGNVTTGLPGTDVSITMRGTAENPILDFVIPRGSTGAVENLPLGNTNPMALGVASPGTSDELSRKDHVHQMPTAAEVGARPDDWMPTAEEVGARPDDWMPTASDVGARPDTWMPTAAQVGARPSNWTPSAADVGALPDTGGTVSGFLISPRYIRVETSNGFAQLNVADSGNCGLWVQNKNGNSGWIGYMDVNGNIILPGTANYAKELTNTLGLDGGGTDATTAEGARANFDLAWKVNDTFSAASYYPIACFLTESSKTLQITLSLGCYINASRVSVTELVGSLRGVSGYLDSDSSNRNLLASPFTVSASIINKKAGLVHIVITKSSAFTNATNNTPASLYATSFSLKFS